MELGQRHKLPTPGLGSAPSARSGARLQAYSSHPEGHKAHRQAEAVRRNSLAWASRCSAGPTSLVGFQGAASPCQKPGPEGLRPGSARGCGSPLCRAPHRCSPPPQVSQREKSSHSKAQTVAALRPGLLFAPQIRHAAIKTRLAICRARGESERDLGGSRWPPDGAERQTAEMLPATALPRQSQHASSGQGLLRPPPGSQLVRGCPAATPRGTTLSCKKSRSGSSRAKHGSRPQRLPASRLLQ